jgi:prepilin-type N-terminal cleavage/methylation domain-containing protein/prepilin-type processing-associated H-X9-DG protein
MKRNAFTLIELLVVISIIAILMSILMPALGKVKQQAQATVCMTNIKTITTASMTYAADHDNKYPLGGSRPLRSWSQGLYPDTPYWDARLMPYIDSGYNVNPKLNKDIAGTALANVNPDIFDFLLCPAAKADPDQRRNINLIADGQSTRAPNRFPKSYRLNSKITGAASVSKDYRSDSKYYYADSLNVSQVNNSSATILVAESYVSDGSSFNNINGWAARSWADIKPAHFVKKQPGEVISGYIWDGSEDDYERTGQSNMGFADGHIDKITRVYTNDYWRYGGEPDTVGIKFLAVGAGTKAEEGLR